MPDKFIGSLLSLISKSEIRYEGILYTINTDEASIALTNVKSFGTEDRPVEKFIAPRSERFEYIIFRASDIKSLEIVKQAGEVEFEDPAIIKAHTNYLPPKPVIDPSGLTFGTSAAPNAASQAPSMASAFSRIGQAAPGSGVRPQPIPMGQNITATGPPAAGPAFSSATVDFRSGSSTPTHWARRSPVSDVGVQTPPLEKQVKQEKTVPQQMSTASGRTDGSSRGDERSAVEHQQAAHQPPLQQQPPPQQQQQQPPQQQQQQRQQHRQQQHGGQNHPAGFHQPRDGYERRSGPQQQRIRSNGPPPMPIGQQPRMVLMPMNFRGGRQGPPPMGMGPPPPHKRAPIFSRLPPQLQRPPHYQRQPGRKPQQETTGIKISDDYDFEKANKEFEELEGKLSKAKISDDEDAGKVKENGDASGSGEPEVEETTAKGDEPFYNKEKSFFDMISCEALERSKGKVNRIDWRKERKINVETFGTSANYRRGGYRGRGGYNYRQNYNRRYGGGQRNNNNNNSSGGGDRSRTNDNNRPKEAAEAALD